MGNIIGYKISNVLSKYLHLFFHVDICKTIVPRKLTYCLSSKLVNISLVVMPDFSLIKEGLMYFKIYFHKRYVVMTVCV